MKRRDETSAVTLEVRHRQEHRGASPRFVSTTLPVRLSETALLLIDVYPTSGPEAVVVRDAIVPARAAARAAGLPVVYVTNRLNLALHAHSKSREVWRRTLGQDVLDVWSEPSEVLQYLPEVAPAEGDIEVAKAYYSGFFETSLDQTLDELGAKTLVVAGFESQICVTATVCDALYRNYGVVVLRDAIGTGEAQDLPAGSARAQSIRFFETSVGYTALTAHFIAALADAH